MSEDWDQSTSIELNELEHQSSMNQSPWMKNAKWEARAIVRWISEKELVFESIKGKHLYRTS